MKKTFFPEVTTVKDDMKRTADGFMIKTEPYYLASGNEIQLFESAYDAKIPVMLKGPTGCGKTRFVEYMAFRLNRPLITVSCHEDLTSSDLVGRFLLEAEQTG